MKRAIILILLTPLTACGLTDSNAMKPGKWRTTTEIESFEAPGMPASAVEQMKAAAKGAAVEICMSKEMAAAPSADTFAPKGGGCTASKFEVADGKIAAKMSCTAGGAKQDIEMDGTIAPELYTIRSTVNSSVPGMGKTKMVTKVESKRIGDC
jgi:uncharacterized protein DUF3617